MDIDPSNVLEHLKAPFPASAHKERSLPGGGRYIYVPWVVVVDRLNDLLSLDWSEEYSDPAISGDYLSIRCRLSIMGVHREGIGTIRTYPELNDEGKEKIIGDPPNNATRDAFWDAAYKFGIGRYLDDQAGVRDYLRRSDRLNAAMKQHKQSKAQVLDLMTANALPSDLYVMSDDQCARLVRLMESSAQLSKR